MINFINIDSIQITKGTLELPYKDAADYFKKIYKDYDYKFLLESKDISPIYGRMSLIGVSPVLKLSGKNNKFKIEVLEKRGQFYFDQIGREDLNICDKVYFKENFIEGVVQKGTDVIPEERRSRKKNIAQIIRVILDKFKIKERESLGLYGALSYDFIRLFEDIKSLSPENETEDFTLFLYDTFIYFDHLKEKTEIICFRENENEVEKDITKLVDKLQKEDENKTDLKYEIKDAHFALSQKEFEAMVERAKLYAEEGDIFEVVFSDILKTKFKGDPFALYLNYRKANPSPYLFYYDFGDEQLVGASPEMMVRCENGIAHLRPIAGTAKRGKDPIEDHENMLALLQDPKERAELDMLIDLGRNDLSRVCEPGIKIKDYRFVEKYSKVMHTVSHIYGNLRKEFTALDALIACLNAGTLTGAPKVSAMQIIEKHEKERRGYYGGVIGYFAFSGEMDTGIIIRTAHIKGEDLRFQVGASLLYDSNPKKEYKEIMNKASAFLTTFTQK